jgi:hypothetical protein
MEKMDNNNLDLKHSMSLGHTPDVSIVADAYIPGSKSTDLIKPSASQNLDNQQPPGKYFATNVKSPKRSDK